MSTNVVFRVALFCDCKAFLKRVGIEMHMGLLLNMLIYTAAVNCARINLD